MRDRPRASQLVLRDGRYRLIRRPDSGTFMIVATIDGHRYRVGAGADLRLARARLADFIAECEGASAPVDTGNPEIWQRVARRVVLRHRFSAKARGIDFDLTATQVLGRMQATRFRCAVSGIPFSIPRRGEMEVDPWAPSIDRIENRHGYTLENIRVVSIAANYAMNRWGLDMLLRLARGVILTADSVAMEDAIAAENANSSGGATR